jgi:LAO/AO transport system kinase
MNEISRLIQSLSSGDFPALARAITLVENELPGADTLLQNLTIHEVPLIGITGPPGVGKSSLVNALLRRLLEQNSRIGVVSVDPTSPFNFGSLLGDRIRMSEHFLHPNVFIRSMASRGSLGGLSDKILEVTDVMKAARFDYLLVETVGVGQSEVEIAGLADTTLVVFVPDTGDEIQAMKAGLMEIADIFIVNKSDLENADRTVALLKAMVAPKNAASRDGWQIPVVKTVSANASGIEELLAQIKQHATSGHRNQRRVLFIAEKIRRLIIKDKMKNIDLRRLRSELEAAMATDDFNLYRFATHYFHQ